MFSSRIYFNKLLVPFRSLYSKNVTTKVSKGIIMSIFKYKVIEVVQLKFIEIVHTVIIKSYGNKRRIKFVTFDIYCNF